MRKLFTTLSILFISQAAYAFSPVRQVQISTNTISRQTGTAVIAGLNVSSITVTSSGTFTGSVQISSTVVDGNNTQGTAGQSFQSNAGSAPTWVNVPSAMLTTVSTWTASQVFSANAKSNSFLSQGGQSIYGNFVSSTSTNGTSSGTVVLSGYSEYVVNIDVLNNVAGARSIFLRFNNNNGSIYSYDYSGFYAGVSTGGFCGNNLATQIPLSVNGLTGAIDTVESTQSTYSGCTLHITTHGYSKISGTCSYSNSGLNEIQLAIGANVHQNPLTSLQVWIGQSTSCTSVTDDATGTSANIFVWGVQ